MGRWTRGRMAAAAVVAAVVVTAALGYRYFAGGGMRARQEPWAVEAFVARRLVQLGIHAGDRARQNPLDASPGAADVAAGQGLYRKDCEACHGYDGAGKTEAGGGLYPRPIDVSPAALVARGRSDGELFYLIRNGVRNTGMPAWQLTDEDTWRLVAYLRNLPKVAAPRAELVAHAGGGYVGSSACKSCHQGIYDRWRKTPMANVVRDPREHPDAIAPDLTKPDPLVTFSAADVALVYGSIWKQRYFKKVGDDYYPLPVTWDFKHRNFKPYFVKDDWWAAQYPPDNMQRPTGPLCDGCHSVNYDVEKKTVTEWNVGCERCHGPGGEHVKHASAVDIIDPARMGYVGANDVCIQCHSQGRPKKNPIAGRTYDWPVGYAVGDELADAWDLEEHTLGQTTFTHFADGTAHKNRMQGNDYVQSRMYTRGVTCATCHDAHGTPYPSSLRKPANELCLDCHAADGANGPRARTLAEHTHHAPGSAANECIACHMPKIAQTIADVNVRSHTFRFVTPAQTETSKIPNACNGCHADKTTAWATEALKSWAGRSPWR